MEQKKKSNFQFSQTARFCFVSDYIQFAFHDLRKEVQTMRVFLPNEENEFVVQLWNGSKIDLKKGGLG
jgi:hypothetical protein